MACAGCGSSPKKPTGAPTAATSADAQAAEALAVFELQRDGARAWTLISGATKQAPNRVDLAYLQASLCQLLEGCQSEPYDARVRKLDPGNGAIWMHALENAQRLKEAAVEAQIVDAIGNAQRFDVYWNPLVASITTARIAKGSGANAALSETIDWLGSTVVPQFQPLTLACSRSRTTDQQWAERCRRVARVLMNSDTYIAESIGVVLAQQVAAQSPEQAQLKERARTSRYLWRTYAEITNSQIERDKFSLELVELMRKLRREQDVQLAVVRWAGRPVTPPPEWKDETW
jgi:hypothetical protein